MNSQEKDKDIKEISKEMTHVEDKVFVCQKFFLGNSLAVQRLRFRAFTAGGPCSILVGKPEADLILTYLRIFSVFLNFSVLTTMCLAVSQSLTYFPDIKT